ncbi:MAG: Glutamyl-tRNA reductase [Pelotomaculum sp. PtaB.Bin104]|nr:MAG: Glutamyl-tRNA reductase [Pelotomaculum sp. PtaB.Bin104]
MLIVVVGLSHRTAPVELRERLSFAGCSLQEALMQIKSYPAIKGCAVLSTCNRTEVYAATLVMDEGLSAIWDFLSRWANVDISEIKNFTYSHTLCDAVRHLFRVTSGLDSMLLGETEVLGQVRSAYQAACACEATNRVLNTLFQQAIEVGKRVRTETGIDRNAVSLSYAAVELARRHLGDLNNRQVLLIGAGKMSGLSAQYLVAHGVSGIIVSNRSFERAKAMADQMAGKAVKFNELPKYLETADIVISCTAAPHVVVKFTDLERAMVKRRGRQMLIIDLAVPRDIEAAAGSLAGVILYDIDDLETVVDHNLAGRKQAAFKAEGIIEEELTGFMSWLGTQYVVPTIVALKQRGDQIKEQELKRALNRLEKLSEHDRKVISSLANSIVNQILHTPVTQLKSYALTTEGHLYSRIMQNLFCLEVPGQDHKEQTKTLRSDKQTTG